MTSHEKSNIFLVSIFFDKIIYLGFLFSCLTLVIIYLFSTFISLAPKINIEKGDGQHDHITNYLITIKIGIFQLQANNLPIIIPTQISCLYINQIHTFQIPLLFRLHYFSTMKIHRTIYNKAKITK